MTCGLDATNTVRRLVPLTALMLLLQQVQASAYFACVAPVAMCLTKQVNVQAT